MVHDLCACLDRNADAPGGFPFALRSVNAYPHAAWRRTDPDSPRWIKPDRRDRRDADSARWGCRNHIRPIR